jgi:hypothetical protein
MKKVISITLTFIILTALIHFSVATHYCGGTIAATKVSLSGKLANCGMENDEKDIPESGTKISSHCCDNIVVFCGINGNYFPSYTSVPETYRQYIHDFSIPENLNFNSVTCLKSIVTSESPPGDFAPDSVDLSTIRIYRI